jgi:hypothetical protein
VIEDKIRTCPIGYSLLFIWSYIIFSYLVFEDKKLVKPKVEKPKLTKEQTINKALTIKR